MKTLIKRMFFMKVYKKISRITKSRLGYFSKWYYPVIREIVTFGNRKYSSAKIAGLLKPLISEKQAREALDQLLSLGLIKRDQEDCWEQCNQHISTGREVRSKTVAQFHREMLRLASGSIERFPSSERDISSLTFSINAGRMRELKQLIASFRDQVRSILAEGEKADQVLQLNIQLFPLTKIDDQNESK